jgi:NADP-reducing hydrogenase subunit HndB
MGTCGIAAGAKAVLDAFISALDTDNLMETVLVKQSGCMGFCPQEPTVEVAVPGMDTAVYGRVDPAAVREIVSKHIINKQFLDDHILNRRAATQ